MFSCKNQFLLRVFLFLFMFDLNNANNLTNCQSQNGFCVPPIECKLVLQVNISESDTNNCVDASNNTGVCCMILKRKLGDISKQKCAEVYERRPPPEPEKILGGGGYDALAKEFPHMAALGYGADNDTFWGCGGSLISGRFVLTAAHCINSILGPIKRIRLGDVKLPNDYDDPDGYPADYNISRVIMHPSYKPPSFYHDIALIELDRSVDPSTDDSVYFVAPACLQTEKDITNPLWKSTGWGETFYNGPPANHLQVIELEATDLEACKKAFKAVGPRKLGRGIDENSQLCARHANRDTCQGDSGGPLQIENAKYLTGHTVIGITSFGPPCLLTPLGGVFTRVSHYIEWIESIVWPE